MKILLFTHKVDIDGMGSAVLGKMAFKDLQIVFCEAYNVTDEIMPFYQNGTIYDYDYIYVADLCPKQSFLELVNNDSDLKSKFYVFDHHASSLEEGNDQYSFTHICVKNDKGMCSGTSLFYQYLVDSHYLLPKPGIDYFVELTRRSDTWEWRTIYHDQEANDLSILYSVYGNNAYIESMYQKLINNEEFSFSEIEKKLISNKKELTEVKVEELAQNIYYQELLDYKVGIIFITYEYRSVLAEYLREHNYDIDIVMMIALDHKSISYRTIKKGKSARKIAEYFGGRGHEEAAGSVITEKQLENIIQILTNN